MFTEKHIRLFIFAVTAVIFYFWVKENRPEWFTTLSYNSNYTPNTDNANPATQSEYNLEFDETNTFDRVGNRNYSSDESNHNVININIDPDGESTGYATT